MLYLLYKPGKVDTNLACFSLESVDLQLQNIVFSLTHSTNTQKLDKKVKYKNIMLTVYQLQRKV